ncbi:MAG: endonuclease III, partial [Myxococcales bacterium]|nr:endonuclease III [Myxococcales bacterium]
MGSRTRNSIRAEPPRGRNADLGGAVATPGPDVTARVARVAATLMELWPDAVVELDHTSAYQLLVATILAAQSTDKLINTVTPALFSKYADPTALARADQGELEKMIFSTGFYRNKAKHVIGMARRIVEAHGGRVPETMEGLVDLPGVARKTANVVLGSALGKNEGVVVDTHVSRLAPRLGFTTHTDPVKIEQDLMRLVPRDQWSIFAHRLIWHGRRVCHAKKPDCDHCALAPMCPSYGIAGTDAEVRKPTGRQPLTRAQSAAKAKERAASDAMTGAAAKARAIAAKAKANAPSARTNRMSAASSAKSAAAAAAAKPAAAKPAAAK